MKAYHSEFKHNYSNAGAIDATVRMETKDQKGRQIKFTFDYSCLPSVLRDLSKLWQQERLKRLSAIERINKSLPDHA